MAFQWDTVAIIGVGAIGASLGLGLRERGIARRVVGATRSEASARVALERGAVDAMLPDMEAAAQDAELTVVCTPVLAIVDHVRRCAAAAPHGALITDAGSTKGSIAESLATLQPTFVGSHPLAGTHLVGPQAGDPHLFADRSVIITPVSATPQHAVERIEQFWQSLGARVERMSPQRHDELLAASSHVPHAIATLLAATTAEDALPYAAKGWKDTTRIAAGSPELWGQILRDNRRHTLNCLRSFGASLAQLIEALERDDSERLTNLLQQGKQNRDAVGN